MVREAVTCGADAAVKRFSVHELSNEPHGCRSWRGVNLEAKVVTCVPGRTQQRFATRSVLLPSDVPGPEEVMTGNINLES